MPPLPDSANVPITGGLSGGTDSVLSLLPPEFIQKLTPESLFTLGSVPAYFRGTAETMGDTVTGNYYPGSNDIRLDRAFYPQGVHINPMLTQHESIHALDRKYTWPGTTGYRIIANSTPEQLRSMAKLYGKGFNVVEAVPMAMELANFDPRNLPPALKESFAKFFRAGAMK